MNIEIIKVILLFSLIPLATMLIGGFLGIFFNVKNNIRSIILHLAAGVIFAVVSIELLPDIVEKENIMGVSIGFFAGLFVMLLIKHFSHKSEEKHKNSLKNNPSQASLITNLIPWALIIGIAVDIFIDGILLGVGFAAGQSEGVLLCVALSIEILVLGLVVSAELKAEKITKTRIIQIISFLAITFVFGAFAGAIMLSVLNEDVLTYILAFGLSALMYLVTEELLVEAHEQKDTAFNTTIFFVGFFIFLIIAMLH